MSKPTKPSLLANLLQRSPYGAVRPRQVPRLFQAKLSDVLKQSAAAEAAMPKLVADMEAELTAAGYVKVHQYQDESVWTTKLDDRVPQPKNPINMDYDELERRVIYSMGGPEAVQHMMCNVSPTGRLRSFPLPVQRNFTLRPYQEEALAGLRKRFTDKNLED